jgi:hypothetical protein
MPTRSSLAAALLLAGAATASAHRPEPLPPLTGAPAPRPVPDAGAPVPLGVPPISPDVIAPEPAAPPGASPPTAAPSAPAQPPAPSRIFCEQTVTYRLADPASVAPNFQPFVGIWSDADWTPSLCAALIVESVQGNGTATLTYAYGPLAAGQRTPGGVLHGTGIIRDGQLQFQNNDGSQFTFKPFYADLQGQLTTPQGQTYQAVFKRTY